MSAASLIRQNCVTSSAHKEEVANFTVTDDIAVRDDLKI